MHWEFAEGPPSRDEMVRWLQQDKREEKLDRIDMDGTNKQSVIGDEEDMLFSQVRSIRLVKRNRSEDSIGYRLKALPKIISTDLNTRRPRSPAVCGMNCNT
jgi:hypothetical protein